MAKTIVRNFRKNSEIKTYQLPEKDRQAIIASNPWPSVWKVIETQRAAFKKRYGDNFFQEKTYKLSEKLMLRSRPEQLKLCISGARCVDE